MRDWHPGGKGKGTRGHLLMLCNYSKTQRKTLILNLYNILNTFISDMLLLNMILLPWTYLFISNFRLIKFLINNFNVLFKFLMILIDRKFCLYKLVIQKIWKQLYNHSKITAVEIIFKEYKPFLFFHWQMQCWRFCDKALDLEPTKSFRLEWTERTMKH